MFKYTVSRSIAGFQDPVYDLVKDWIEDNPFLNSVENLQNVLNNSDFKLEFCRAYLEGLYQAFQDDDDNYTRYADGSPIRGELEATAYMDEFSTLGLTDKDYYEALKKFKPDFSWKDKDEVAFIRDYFEAIEKSKQDNSWKNSVDTSICHEYSPAVFLIEKLEDASEGTVTNFYKKFSKIKVDDFEKVED